MTVIPRRPAVSSQPVRRSGGGLGDTLALHLGGRPGIRGARLGAVPLVCAWCRDVRDDRGRWWRRDRRQWRVREALLSHGICPPCYGREMKEVVAREWSKESVR